MLALLMYLFLALALPEYDKHNNAYLRDVMVSFGVFKLQILFTTRQIYHARLHIA